MAELYISFSKRGQQVLILNGYKYYKVETSFKDQIKWRCCSKDKKCLANVFTNNDATDVLNCKGTHNHDPLSANELLLMNITNSLKCCEDIGIKGASYIMKKELPKIPGFHLLNSREKKNIYHTVRRHIKFLQQQGPDSEVAEDQSCTKDLENDNPKISEESFESYPEDSTLDKSEVFYEPETAFVPGNITIKDEPIESVEDDNLNVFPEELHVSPSELIPETCLKVPSSGTDPLMMCENALTMAGDNHGHFQEAVNTYHTNHETFTPEINNVASSNSYDFTNLNNVVHKLENISNKLAAAAFADHYDQFGKYLASLLRGIPHNKFLSLKQKFIYDVIQARMALDNMTNPTSGNCTVSKSTDSPDCRSLFSENESKDYHYECTPRKHNSNIDILVSSGQKDNHPFRSASNTPKLPLQRHTPSSLTYFSPVLSNDLENTVMDGSSTSSETSGKRQSKSATSKKPSKKPRIRDLKGQPIAREQRPAPKVTEVDPLRFTEGNVEMDIEEGAELMEIKPDILGTSILSNNSTEPIDTLTLQEPVAKSKQCEATSSKISKEQSNPSLLCGKCNLDFSSSIDLKRHFMVAHPGHTLSLKKKLSSGNEIHSNKRHSEETPSTSLSTRLNFATSEQIEIPGLDSKKTRFTSGGQVT